MSNDAVGMAHRKKKIINIITHLLFFYMVPHVVDADPHCRGHHQRRLGLLQPRDGPRHLGADLVSDGLLGHDGLLLVLCLPLESEDYKGFIEKTYCITFVIHQFLVIYYSILFFTNKKIARPN